jgi:cysteine desulfurase
MIKNKFIYLDNNSTTQVDPSVLAEMLPYFGTDYGNPASPHSLGLKASTAVETNREYVKNYFNIQSGNLFFTSSATESINLAIAGLAYANYPTKKHLITQTTEHPAVLETMNHLRALGFQITILEVDGSGFVNPDDVKNAIVGETLLVSIMAANNEIGTLQDVSNIGMICAERDVIFHSDITQAAGRYIFDVEAQNIDIVSGGAHKIHGPKGIGYLGINLANKKIKINPLLFGGGQENGLSPGTLNVPLIVGISKALTIFNDCREVEADYLLNLKARFLDIIQSNLGAIKINGPKTRLMNNLSICFGEINTSEMIKEIKGIAFSTGSACASESGKKSTVLRAIGLTDSEITSTARFGFSRFNTEEEIVQAAMLISEYIKHTRK